ncbi:ribbon-helix-helix domain-containing protein [Enterobacterales bacterium AW_CKDN230030176-1A_HGKHYDSX7]
MQALPATTKSAPRQGRWPSKPCIDPFDNQFDMSQARPISRSVRLNGFATCLRLERVYWRILERIAAANDCSVSAVLSYLDREVHLRHGGVKNFSGLVRVVCVNWLLDPPPGLRAAGRLHSQP